MSLSVTRRKNLKNLGRFICSIVYYYVLKTAYSLFLCISIIYWVCVYYIRDLWLNLVGYLGGEKREGRLNHHWGIFSEYSNPRNGEDSVSV